MTETNIIKRPRDWAYYPNIRQLATELRCASPAWRTWSEREPMANAELAATWYVDRLWDELGYTSETSGLSGYIGEADAQRLEAELLKIMPLTSAIAKRVILFHTMPLFGLFLDFGILRTEIGGYVSPLFQECNPHLNKGFIPSSRLGRIRAAVKRNMATAETQAKGLLGQLPNDCWQKPDGTMATDEEKRQAVVLIKTIDAITLRPLREPDEYEQGLCADALAVASRYAPEKRVAICHRLHASRSKGIVPSTAELILRRFDGVLADLAPEWSNTKIAPNCPIAQQGN